MCLGLLAYRFCSLSLHVHPFTVAVKLLVSQISQGKCLKFPIPAGFLVVDASATAELNFSADAAIVSSNIRPYYISIHPPETDFACFNIPPDFHGDRMYEK